jgi:hypothetical protein
MRDVIADRIRGRSSREKCREVKRLRRGKPISHGAFERFSSCSAEALRFDFDMSSESARGTSETAIERGR